jgi:hypothetical protein
VCEIKKSSLFKKIIIYHNWMMKYYMQQGKTNTILVLLPLQDHLFEQIKYFEVNNI